MSNVRIHQHKNLEIDNHITLLQEITISSAKSIDKHMEHLQLVDKNQPKKVEGGLYADHLNKTTARNLILVTQLISMEIIIKIVEEVEELEQIKDFNSNWLLLMLISQV